MACPGEFINTEQLEAAGLVSNEYSNNTKYPIETVYQILKLTLSRQM